MEGPVEFKAPLCKENIGKPGGESGERKKISAFLPCTLMKNGNVLSQGKPFTDGCGPFSQGDLRQHPS